MTRPIPTLVLALLIAGPLTADNWPQWRGPALDGTSAETGLPLTWSTDGDTVAWKLPMPARSGATPIVWGETIFLSVSRDPEESDALELWAVERGAGKPLWKRSLGGGNELKYKQHMSTPSPVTDGKSVWVMTGTGVLKAFDFEGQELWARDIQKDYGEFGLKWGYASSPLLYEDALYIQVLHGMETDDPSYLLRIDKATGETVWQVERPTDAVWESPDSYATPALLRHGGVTEIVISGGDVLTGHAPATGEELWRAEGLNPGNDSSQRLVASPVVSGDTIFAFGKRGPVLAFRAGGRGDVGESHLVWSMEKGTDVPTPVSDGEHLFVANDKGVMWCLDARTGKALWGPERISTETFSASPILADGRVYATSENGVTTVVKAGPEFEILARNDLDGYTLSSPAVSDGQIFIRTADYLFAIGERASR
jgi:outer membrane protein assembly factor BamB